MIEFCEKNNIKYTRFVDDLTFSSQVDFGDKIAHILEIIHQSKFRINWRKTKYQGKQITTVILLNPSRMIAPKPILDKVEFEKLLPQESPKPYIRYKENIDRVNYNKVKSIAS